MSNNQEDNTRLIDLGTHARDLMHSIRSALCCIYAELDYVREQVEREDYAYIPDTITRAINGLNHVSGICDIGIYHTADKVDNVKNSLTMSMSYPYISTVVMDSIRNAVSNVFDTQYHEYVAYKYWRDEETFVSAEKEWMAIDDDSSVCAFVEKYLFDINIDLSGLDVRISDSTRAATRMRCLFHELLLNSMKNMSILERDKRNLKIEAYTKQGVLGVLICNSCADDASDRVSSTGLGTKIIEGLVSSLGGEYSVSRKEGIYEVDIRFNI